MSSRVALYAVASAFPCILGIEKLIRNIAAGLKIFIIFLCMKMRPDINTAKFQRILIKAGIFHREMSVRCPVSPTASQLESTLDTINRPQYARLAGNPHTSGHSQTQKKGTEKCYDHTFLSPVPCERKKMRRWSFQREESLCTHSPNTRGCQAKMHLTRSCV